MAHLHFKRTAYKSGGGSAVSRVAYVTRTPVHELDRAEQLLRYISNGEREDVVFTTSRNLPDWCHGKAHTFFQAAEQYERSGGVAFEEWKISLPVELSRRQNMQLMHELVDAIAGERLPCTYAFHDPTTMDGHHRQPHLHLLISSRQQDGIARRAAQHFKRWNAQHPERGGAQKDPAMNHMGAVKAHRILIADVLNVHLEQAGHAARVHPDTLTDRGIDRTPEPKLVPRESREYREQGIISARMQQVLDIRAERTQQSAREQNNARMYWEARKQALGITRDMSMDTQRAHLMQARAHKVHHAPARLTLAQRREQERRLEHSVNELETYVGDLRQVRQREQRLERRQGSREWKDELAAEQVLARGKSHGLPRDVQAEQNVAKIEQAIQTQSALRQLRGLTQRLEREESQAGGGVGVRLYDRERDRGHGLGW